MSPERAGPDFLGIGVQKCGTTWIAEVLRQHPSVLMRKKEINYWDRFYWRGATWYEHHFAGRGHRVAGEITPACFIAPAKRRWKKEDYPLVWPRHWFAFWRRRGDPVAGIRDHYPDARLFVVLRNPVERAWAQYWMYRHRKGAQRRGWLARDFAAMFRADGRWLRSTGDYARHLARWKAVHPGLRIVFFDDLKRDPRAFARELYACIGVDPGYEPVLPEKVNPGHYEPMPESDRALAHDAYREGIERLQEMCQRDLSAWLD